MSTTSSIWYKQADGIWKGCYCHYNGDIYRTGKKLYNYYNEYELAQELVNKYYAIASVEPGVANVRTLSPGWPFDWQYARSKIQAQSLMETEFYYFYDPDAINPITKQIGVWYYYDMNNGTNGMLSDYF